MAEALNVEVRELRGKRNARRLRRDGQVPLILYGHGKENVCLRTPEHDLAAVIRHGARVVDLKGAVKESAFIREVQWDTYGIEILHADLTRVKAGETVETPVQIELRGEAPGVKAGGVVQALVHEVMIDCPFDSLPEKLTVNVNELELDAAITAAVLDLPEGAKLVTPADTVIVQCVPAAVEEEEEEGVVAPVEPEVIGRKPDEETED
jgi:large subunit ribosomal protein L25